MDDVVSIGDPYPVPLRNRVEGTPHLVMCDEFVQLVLLVSTPTPDEERSFTSPRMDFAFIGGDDALVLGVKLRGQRWWDAPWQAARQTEHPPGLPGAPGDAVAVRMALVDTVSSRVRALREVGWPPALADAIRANIAHQLLRRGTAEAGNTEIQRWYDAYPSPTDLVIAEASVTARAVPYLRGSGT
jgi:hypothetical protein